MGRCDKYNANVAAHLPNGAMVISQDEVDDRLSYSFESASSPAIYAPAFI